MTAFDASYGNVVVSYSFFRGVTYISETTIGIRLQGVLKEHDFNT